MMKINPDWNYGYLRADEGYGKADPASVIAGAVGEVAKLGGALTGYFTQRDQISANEREQRLALRQQAGEADTGWQDILTLFAQKQQNISLENQQKAQSDTLKNVLYGVVALAAIGALGYGVYQLSKD